MKIDKPLNYLDKQKILYGENKNKELQINYGNFYLDKRQLSDAIEFFIAALDQQNLEKVIPIVVEEGDFFLYNQIVKFLNIKNPEWSKIGETAVKLGKLVYAVSAYTKLGSQEKINSLNELINRGRAE